MGADSFERWRELVFSARSGRYEAGRDLAFWQGKAAAYDESQPALPNTVAWLRQDLSGAQSLLEVGAGTGRLLLPLLDAVAQITALDYSPEMLATLKAKNPPAHVTLRCQSLAEAATDPALKPHDAVLAAWSLAYQPDLRAALHSLFQLTNRRLYLLEDDGVGSPHVQLRRALAGSPKPRRASLLREAVAALGWEYQVQTVTERRELTFSGTSALLDFVRLPMAEDEVLRVLQPYLTPQGTGWCYSWPFEVQLLRVVMT